MRSGKIEIFLWVSEWRLGVLYIDRKEYVSIPFLDRDPTAFFPQDRGIREKSRQKKEELRRPADLLGESGENTKVTRKRGCFSEIKLANLFLPNRLCLIEIIIKN